MVIDLSATTIPFTLHLPSAHCELLLRCDVTAQIDSMNENIKLAATKGYTNNKESNAAQLKTVIERIKVTEEKFPLSLERFCTRSLSHNSRFGA